ncbi:class I SAM-dependent methyltransferase [Oleiphilus sp. HI0061]|uniref:class I SAM-dependent methyltransferase n=1 Tax=Oleiphilus sp. HI0061 TaxID=1822239 RepID=UPI0008390A15|nr:methyltransferase domain-containing protein [Oleiphilus sp. HI0061]
MSGLQDLDKNAQANSSKQQQLEQWFQSALGRSLLADQRRNIANKIHRLFGYHQAEIGVSHRVPVGNPSSLGHKFYVLPEWEPDLPENSIISSSEELALESETQDVVILHHALDFSSAPHQTLREAARVLKSSGTMVIVGFNPLSTWGVRRLLGRSQQAPWNSCFIGGKRIEDWLNLLDFRVGTTKYHYYGLPFNNAGLFRRFLWLDKVLNTKVPLGAYYLISAQKQVGSRINSYSKWRRGAKVVGMPLASSRHARVLEQDFSVYNEKDKEE